MAWLRMNETVSRPVCRGCDERSLRMHWDLGLPLLIMLVTLIAMAGLAYFAKKMLLDPRQKEGRD